MTIDEALIKYLEDLSSLTFSDGEKPRLKSDLEKVLAYMARLSELDTQEFGQAEETPEYCALREDEAVSSFPRDLILRNAPRKNGETIIAPQTVE